MVISAVLIPTLRISLLPNCVLILLISILFSIISCLVVGQKVLLPAINPTPLDTTQKRGKKSGAHHT